MMTPLSDERLNELLAEVDRLRARVAELEDPQGMADRIGVSEPSCQLFWLGECMFPLYQPGDNDAYDCGAVAIAELRWDDGGRWLLCHDHLRAVLGGDTKAREEATDDDATE